MGFDCQPQVVSRISGKVWRYMIRFMLRCSSSKYVIILVGFLPVGTGSIPRFMQDRHGRQICQVSIQLKVNDTMDLGENMTDDVTPCRGCFLLGNIYIVENSCPQYFQFSFSFFFRVFEIWWNMFDSPDGGASGLYPSTWSIACLKDHPKIPTGITG